MYLSRTLKGASESGPGERRDSHRGSVSNAADPAADEAGPSPTGEAPALWSRQRGAQVDKAQTLATREARLVSLPRHQTSQGPGRRTRTDSDSPFGVTFVSHPPGRIVGHDADVDDQRQPRRQRDELRPKAAGRAGGVVRLPGPGATPADEAAATGRRTAAGRPVQTPRYVQRL